MSRAEFEAERKTLGLSIRDFCALTNLHPTTVSRWGREIPAIPGWVPHLLAAWRITGVPPVAVKMP